MVYWLVHSGKKPEAPSNVSDEAPMQSCSTGNKQFALSPMGWGRIDVYLREWTLAPVDLFSQHMV